MTLIPGMFQLKDPVLVERWERFKPYVQQAPPVDEFTILVNHEYPDWQIGLRRAASMPSSAFFMKVRSDDVKRLDGLGDGELFSGVMTEYKIDGRTPFIIRRVTVTDLQVRGDDLELVEKHKPFAWFRSLVTAFREVRSGVLEPDVQELDELLDFLDGAEPREPDDE